MPDRTFLRGIAKQHFHRSRPSEWYDVLYRSAERDSKCIPWADSQPNNALLQWKSSHAVIGSRAVVVGCGLGDDAEEVASWGIETIAFDVSTEAIEWCRSRFPHTRVDYTVGDIFCLPEDWNGAFDFVLEINTIQALPPEYRERTIEALAGLTSEGGQILSIVRARDEDDDPGDMPWPLSRTELMLFEKYGMRLLEFDEYMDDEEPSVRRFRTLWRREIE